MGFINYIKDKKDFCQLVDLLDLVDLELFDTKELDILTQYKLNEDNINFNNVINLCKFPICSDLYDKNKNCIEDAVFYKVVTYNQKEDLFILDKKTKHIIVDNINLYYWYSRINYLFSSKRHINFTKDSIDEYTILTIQDIKEEIVNMVRNRQDELMKLNYDRLYKEGENLIKDEDLIDNLTQEVKINYVYDINMYDIKPKLDYIYTGRKNSSLVVENNLAYFILMYLRDKQQILDLTDNAFYKTIDDNCYDARNLNEKFYKHEKKMEIYEELKSSLEIDEDLNRFKAIIYAVKQAGKTVVINDNKYDNFINKRHCPCDIEVGTYHSGHIALKDIKTVKFSRKVLFDIEEYNKGL